MSENEIGRLQQALDEVVAVAWEEIVDAWPSPGCWIDRKFYKMSVPEMVEACFWRR